MPHYYKIVVIAALCIGISVPAVHAGWKDWLGGVVGAGGKKSTGGSLSDREVVEGLKEALKIGTERAVKGLGRRDGYLMDASVKILMPERLRSAEKTLRKLKLNGLADEFIETMNRAAEQAIPQATDIVWQTIRGMSFRDAWNVLRGPDDAATNYFRQQSEPQLISSIKPIVQQATAKTGVTSAYKRVVDKTAFLEPLLKRKPVDLDDYVTREALDGLFVKLAEEEKRIRQDPIARTTDLLRKVFSL